MKKAILLCFLVFIFAESFSQKVRLGLRFAPGLAYSRVNEEIDTLEFGGRGLGVRFFAGPEVNFVLSENYVFTTGLWYLSRRAGISIADYNIKQVVNLQYLQIPATLKLYTNDIAVDTKLYFQLGATADIKLQERERLTEVLSYIDNFRFYDFSTLIGAGLQLQMGQNTYLFGGITYLRGLINSISTSGGIVLENGQYSLLPLDVSLKNDMLGLDIGIRF